VVRRKVTLERAAAGRPRRTFISDPAGRAKPVISEGMLIQWSRDCSASAAMEALVAMGAVCRGQRAMRCE
jgi:hypothetical protein